MAAADGLPIDSNARATAFTPARLFVRSAAIKAPSKIPRTGDKGARESSFADRFVAHAASTMPLQSLLRAAIRAALAR